jgi:phage terminase large subunit-like protein
VAKAATRVVEDDMEVKRAARQMLAMRDAARAELRRREGLKLHKEECEESLASFVRTFWVIVEPTTKLVEGWPLEMICDILTSITDGHSVRDIINVPPGFMKSYLLNVFWPAWEWGPQNMPGLRYLAASYSGELASRDNGGDVGRFSRLINSVEYKTLWGDRFKVVKDNAGLVENDKTGSKRVVTMSGGATTGFRGDRILIDDANNPLDVESDTVRATTNIWLREVMPSRVNSASRSAIINIQQRTHEEDATGILVKYGGAWRWTCIPMHYDPLRATPIVLNYDEDGKPLEVFHDPRGLDPETGELLEGLFRDARGKLQLRPGSPMAKAEGALAWPERFSQEDCDKLRNALGEYAYEGQYQQSPGVRGGGIIRRDWWQVWEGAYPDLGTTLAILDTAIEEGEKNDWNALITLGAFPGPEGEPKLIMTSGGKKRCQIAELVEWVAQVCTYRKIDYLLIERKTRGKDVHDEIVRLYANASWQTVLVDVTATKIARLKAVSHLFSGDLKRDPQSGIEVYSGGIIYAPDRDWADEVIDQVSAFPRGSHDDYVDCISMGLGWVRRNGVVLRKVEWDAEELERKKFKKSISVPYAIRR